jgi:DNA repair exonuclease SbcCD ATPase subunit
MRLETISIVGFGRLTNAEFAFHPGINLIVGPNEAGKSTLLQAIFTLLYGFYDSGSVTGSRRELMSALRPWDSKAEYRGSLTFSLAGGQRYRVERDFGNRMSTSLRLLPHKVDVTGQFRSDSYGRLYFADELLGMNRTVFEHTCCLHQSELEKLENSATAITDAITRLATAGAGDANSVQAIEVLRTLLRDEIGSQRAWTKPLASAQNEQKLLEHAVVTAIQRQEQMWSMVREINQYEERIAHLAAEKERQEYVRLLAEQAERRQARARIDQARQEVERQRKTVDELQRYSSAPVHLLDDLMRNADRRADLKVRVERAASARSDLERQIETLERELPPSIEPLGQTKLSVDVQPATRDRILSLHTQWRHAMADKETAAQSLAASTAELDRLLRQFEHEKVVHSGLLEIGMAGLARLRASFDQAKHQVALAKQELNHAEEEWRKVGMTESAYQALVVHAREIATGEAAPEQRKGCNPFGPSKPPIGNEPTELVIFREIAPIHDAARQARSAHDKVYGDFKQAEARVRSLLSISNDREVTDGLFDAAHADLEDLKRLETRLQLQREKCSEDRENLSAREVAATEAHIVISQALKTQGIETEDPDSGVEEFVRAFDRQTEQANARAKYEAISAQIELISGQLQQLRELDAELSRTERQIHDILIQAGPDILQPSSIDEGIAAFQLLCQRHSSWSTAKRDLAIKDEQLLLLQNLDNEDGTIHQLEVAGRRLQQLVEQHPEWRELVPERTNTEYEQQILEISRDMRAAETEIIRMRHTLDSLEMQHTQLANLFEQQAAAIEQHLHLTRMHRQVTRAIEMLEGATVEFQRSFAPRLETRIAHALRVVTSDRYQQVQVDPTDLGLSVYSPESTGWVSAERLSNGTRDLIYLAMRIAVSDLLSNSKEPLPLLLDDPFVHFDSTREQNAIAYLCEIAKEYQVLFFSKDRTLEERLRNAGQNPSITRLELMHPVG